MPNRESSYFGRKIAVRLEIGARTTGLALGVWSIRVKVVRFRKKRLSKKLRSSYRVCTATFALRQWKRHVKHAAAAPSPIASPIQMPNAP